MNSSSSFSCSSSSAKGVICSTTRTRTRTIFIQVGLAAFLLVRCGASAQITNTLSDAEISGRQLARKLCDVYVENSTNTGVLKVRDAQGRRSEILVECEVITTATNWQNRYQAKFGTNANDVTTLIVTHCNAESNSYVLFERLSIHIGMGLSGNRTMTPFAGSDFWICDLGLEFFHWPDQKILKREFRRNCSCAVLESTNPHPGANSYSRVVSWIDEESGGIVMARAYDAQGRLLKEFYPKDVKKVNGEWQVQSMEIDNVQTGSRTRLELDLKSP